MASAEVKVEREEEIQPSTSGGGKQIGEAEVSDSDEFDDELCNSRYAPANDH